MHKTRFAGLTAPDPDDAALQVDGGSFATRNPDLTDYFLSIGCITHRHDAHAPLAKPVFPASAQVIPSGGLIPSDTEIVGGWTVTDRFGGETTLSPAFLVTTPAPAASPSGSIDVTFNTASGVMPVGQFGYAITIMDAGGGETTVGAITYASREPGFASGRMLLSGLAAELVNTGDRWRLYRTDNGGPLNLIAVGTDDTFIDPGIDPVDHAAQPPFDSTRTKSTNLLQVKLPVAVGASANAVLNDPNAVSINLYLSTDGAFISPSLYNVYPLASAGAIVGIPTLDLQVGQPPDVATSIGGANLIDPDRELLDWHWKRPVASASLLPTGSAAQLGDVRMVIAEGIPYTFGSAATWAPFPDIDLPGLSNVLFEIGATQVLASAVEFMSGSALVLTTAPDGHAIVHVPSGAAGAPGPSGAGTVEIHHDKVVEVASGFSFGAGDGLTASVIVDGAGVANVVYVSTGSMRLFRTWSASASMASGATLTDVMTLAKSYTLFRITTECRLRLRIYDSVAHRDADVSRPYGTPPTGDHGCMFDYIAPGTGEVSRTLVPAVTGANYETDPPTDQVAISVTNLDAAQAASLGIGLIAHEF